MPKKRIITNLKKIRGLTDKIIEMLENDKYCMDIVQQMNAADGLLKSAKIKMLEIHLLTCGVTKLPENPKKFAAEFVKILEMAKK